MVFKLVRIDTQEPCKIQLTIGKHVIGRGKFLHNDETDKRVSRNHAELVVTPDTVSLKSLHQNPCFFMKKSVETHLLHQDTSVGLCHGDKFGLLPDHFWYEVVHCPDQDSVEGRATISNMTENGVHNDEDEGMDQTEYEQDKGNTSALVEELLNYGGEEEMGSIRSASPSLLTTKEEAANQSTSSLFLESTAQSTSDLINIDQVTIKQDSPKNEDQNTENYDLPIQQPRADDVRTPTKRNHSSGVSSPVDLKKVKIEPDSEEEAAGPSNNEQNSSDTDNNDNRQAAPPSPAKPAPPVRERCIYGANCYRRNPQHKAQYSHPTDADWGGGDRGECPYGRACHKADPRHWEHHTHPDGVLPPRTARPVPAPPRAGVQVFYRHGKMFYINAHSVNFYDDHFEVEDSDGDSVDYDYEF